MSTAIPQRQRKRLFHISFIVKDIYESVQAFVDLYGIGPWMVFEHYPINNIKYRGSPTRMDISVAAAYSGSTMIELIQQHDDGPSAYKDMMATHGYGFHHFAFCTEHFDEDMARFRALGFAVANEAAAPPDRPTECRAAYIDTSTRLPGMTELTENDPQMMGAMRDLEAKAANWDGTDPIRVQKFG